MAALMAGATSAAGGTSARPLPSLEPVIFFTNPAGCEYGEALGRIFDGLAVWDEVRQRSRAGDPFRIPGLAAPIGPRLTRLPDGYIRIRAPLRGRWHGLTVTGVETVFMPETDDIVSRILFDAPVARLIEVANGQGFRLDPRTGESAPAVEGAEPESGLYLFAERRSGGSALSCSGG